MHVRQGAANRNRLEALISGVQQHFPEFRFKLIGEPNGFGDHLRVSWGDGADSPIRTRISRC